MPHVTPNVYQSINTTFSLTVQMFFFVSLTSGGALFNTMFVCREIGKREIEERLCISSVWLRREVKEREIGETKF